MWPSFSPSFNALILNIPTPTVSPILRDFFFFFFFFWCLSADVLFSLRTRPIPDVQRKQKEHGNGQAEAALARPSLFDTRHISRNSNSGSLCMKLFRFIFLKKQTNKQTYDVLSFRRNNSGTSKDSLFLRITNIRQIRDRCNGAAT